MQSAREPRSGRAMPAPALRVPATNRTLVWFGRDAEQRRRAAAAAQEALSGRAAYLRALFRRTAAWFIALPKRTPTSAPSGVAGDMSGSRPRVWRRPELFGCVALTGVALAMIGAPFMGAGARPCRTEPAGLTPGANLEVRMTVSHNAACAIWTKAEAVAFDEFHVTVPPKHGSVAPRGRTGVSYRPAPQFTGEDLFAFTLHGRLDARDNSSLVRVRVTVQ